MSQPPPSQPPRPSVLGDLLRTTLVLLAIIAVLAGAGRLLSSPPPEDPVSPVDYEPALSDARDVAPYPVLGPGDLPEGWRANSVRYELASTDWHLGILTDEDRYIGIEQSPDPVEALVEEFAEGADAEGSLEVDGDSWQLLRTEDRTTLVRRDGGATALVTGTASQATIEEFVAGLTGGD